MLEFTDIKGNLNNKNNPILKSLKESKEKKNILYENSKDISILQNESKSKSIENNDETDQKFMNKPPKNFNTKQAKELKKEFIEVCDEDKIGDANNF